MHLWCALLLLSISIAIASAAPLWTTTRGSAASARCCGAGTTRPSKRVAADFSGAGSGAGLTLGGRAILTSNYRSQIGAFATDSLDPLWTRNATQPLLVMGPAAKDTEVFFVLDSDTNRILALDATTGRVVATSRVTVDEGVVWAGLVQSKASLLVLVTGTNKIADALVLDSHSLDTVAGPFSLYSPKQCQFLLDAVTLPLPSLQGGPALFVACQASTPGVTGMDLISGTQRWFAPAYPRSMAAAANEHGATALFVANDESILALDPDTGKPIGGSLDSATATLPTGCRANINGLAFLPVWSDPHQSMAQAFFCDFQHGFFGGILTWRFQLTNTTAAWHVAWTWRIDSNEVHYLGATADSLVAITQDCFSDPCYSTVQAIAWTNGSVVGTYGESGRWSSSPPVLSQFGDVYVQLGNTLVAVPQGAIV